MNWHVSCGIEERNQIMRMLSVCVWDIPTLFYKVKGNPHNRLWKPIRFWDVQDPIVSRRLAHRWRWGCQPYAPVALYPQEDSWYSVLLRGWVNPRAIVRLKGLGKLKNKNSDLTGTPTRYRRVLTMVYNTQNHWVCGLRPSFGILNNKKNQAFRKLGLFLSWGEGEGDKYSIGSSVWG
jgi:hypothetical protein